MTTSPRSTSASPPGRELKLYITAALALAYVGAWLGFGVPRAAKPSAEAQVSNSAAPRLVPAAPAGPARAVWYADLPPPQKPPVSLPPGWQIATTAPATEPATHAAPVVKRAPPTRPRRVRTRSS